MTVLVPTCPECGSTNNWKDGTRQTEYGKVQRYFCRECGYRFSETSSNRSNEPKQVQTVHREPLNTHSSLLSNRQICVSEGEMKNLVKVETQTRKAPRESNIEGQMISFAWYLKKMGRAESTINTYTKSLEILAKYADLLNPEEIN